MSGDKKTSILLVEDEENLHEALKLNLELEGYDVTSAFDGAAALKAIHEARDLLQKAIAINPQAMSGSAYVTLGTLYYMAPKWPIGFGDEATAEKMLHTALKINPNGIDSNYFYGDFLLANNRLNEAEKYFKRAIAVPARTEQAYADNQLKEDAKRALKYTKERKISSSKSLFASLFNSESVK